MPHISYSGRESYLPNAYSPLLTYMPQKQNKMKTCVCQSSLQKRSILSQFWDVNRNYWIGSPGKPLKEAQSLLLRTRLPFSLRSSPFYLEYAQLFSQIYIVFLFMVKFTLYEVLNVRYCNYFSREKADLCSSGEAQVVWQIDL